MDKGDEPETEDGRYYFKIGDTKPFQAVIDAIAYVTGTDPLRHQAIV